MRWAAYNSAYTQLDKQFRRSASFDIHVFGGEPRQNMARAYALYTDFQPRCEVDRA